MSNYLFYLSSIVCNDYISSGGFTLCISNYGNVYSCGRSNYYACGHENELNTLSFKKINGLIDIKMISCGFEHSVCVNYNGEVFSFGKNNYGQLGLGIKKKSLAYSSSPQKINIPPILYVSCGNKFTLCLSEDNKLFSFGGNEFGQLGLGNTTITFSPIQIPTLNDVELFTTAVFYSVCKTFDGTYYSWGYNINGQLGQGNLNKCSEPIKCNNWPDNIISIKGGYYTTLYLTSNGDVYSCGNNNYGQLGIGDSINQITLPRRIEDIPKIQKIDCGYDNCMLIDYDNQLWVFGNNTKGQLGLGVTNAPEKIYKPLKHPTLNNIEDISTGGYHTFVKTMENKIYGFGKNDFSQLGLKTTTSYQIKPIRVLKDNEDIWYSFMGSSRQKSARK